MDLRGALRGGIWAARRHPAGGLPLGARSPAGPPNRRARVVSVAAVAALALVLYAPSAVADGPVGADPGSNYKASPLPTACYGAPHGATCINAGVYYLDQARQRLHEPAYQLPANFPKLPADRQAFILTNLDRVLYHLPPVPKLTAALDRVALGGTPADPGAKGDGDPILPVGTAEATSNWAGGFPNIVVAYEAWMYDDGPGSGNLDCTAADKLGCWGHRHDVLWKFSSPGALAMGAAEAKDSRGVPGYAMLIAKGSNSYTRGAGSYTWTQARADGAGTHHYRVTRPGAAGHSVSIGQPTIHGRTLVIPVHGPRGVNLKCTLSRRKRGQFSTVAHRNHCGSVFKYSSVRRGHYRFQVTSRVGRASTTFTIG